MRILLVDDNEAQIIWLRTMLPDHGIEVVSVVRERSELVARHREAGEPVVLMRDLGEVPAAVLTVELLTVTAGARILLSMRDSGPADLTAARAAGARGVDVRTGRLEDLVAALREVAGEVSES